MKKKLSELKPGARFTYGGVDWVLLELESCEAVVIAAEPVFNRVFDEKNSNDWRRSSLRQELNGEFLDAMIAKGADPAAFLEFESDLTSDNGMMDYWTIIRLSFGAKSWARWLPMLASNRGGK